MWCDVMWWVLVWYGVGVWWDMVYGNRNRNRNRNFDIIFGIVSPISQRGEMNLSHGEMNPHVAGTQGGNG